MHWPFVFFLQLRVLPFPSTSSQPAISSVPWKYIWYYEYFTTNLNSLHITERKGACVCFVYLCGICVVSLNGICSGYPWQVGKLWDKILSVFLIEGLTVVFAVCGVSVCIFRSKGGKKDRETKKESERGDTAQGHAYTSAMCCWIHNIAPLFQPGNHGAIMSRMETCRLHVSIYHWTLKKKKASAAKTWPRNVKWLQRSVLKWEEIMQGTNLLAEVINHKLFYTYSQSTD